MNCFFGKRFPNSKEVRNMMLFTRQQTSLKTAVPVTVDMVAQDTCCPRPMLAGAGEWCRQPGQQGDVLSVKQQLEQDIASPSWVVGL